MSEVDDEIVTDILSVDCTIEGAIASALNDVTARLFRRGKPLLDDERAALAAAIVGDRPELHLHSSFVTETIGIDEARLLEIVDIVESNYYFELKVVGP